MEPLNLWAEGDAHIDHIIKTSNGERLTVTAGPAFSCGFTGQIPTRRLPRLTLTKRTYWAARITAQNDSYIECEGKTRTRAVYSALRSWHHQRWPIYAPRA